MLCKASASRWLFSITQDVDYEIEHPELHKNQNDWQDKLCRLRNSEIKAEGSIGLQEDFHKPGVEEKKRDNQQSQSQNVRTPCPIVLRVSL